MMAQFIVPLKILFFILCFLNAVLHKAVAIEPFVNFDSLAENNSHSGLGITASGCRYDYNFIGDETVLLRSPNYPNTYLSNFYCRYVFNSPVGTKIELNCDDFNVEHSRNCYADRFSVSLTGDASFIEQLSFCGRGVILRTSTSNSLSIEFYSNGYNSAGSNGPYRFQCKLKRIKNVENPCECGKANKGPSLRIVGGKDASIGEIPWRCALYSRTLGVFCACTIISKNFVTTAAHCVDGTNNASSIQVNVGDTDLSSSFEANNELIGVERAILHPNYDRRVQESDIALLKLSKSLTYTRDISPVCLPWKFINREFDGERVTASGWGTKFFGGVVSPHLQVVELDVIGTEKCRNIYRGSSTLITENMICAHSEGKDTCQGDSGGSIDFTDPITKQYYSIGVVSQGVGCAAQFRPGIYAKVVNFLSWISANTVGEEYCRS